MRNPLLKHSRHINQRTYNHSYRTLALIGIFVGVDYIGAQAIHILLGLERRLHAAVRGRFAFVGIG
jgi:hypothetical protein